MFFLLRLAFWIGLVLVLLPSDKAPDGVTTPEINAGDAMSAAASAVSDLSQFCTRQPSTCAVGGQAAQVIGQRAQAGARKVYQIITEKKPDTTGSIDAPLPESAATLTPADLEPAWQEPITAPQTVPADAPPPQ